MFVELKKTFRLSIPITIGLVGHGLFGLTDSIMIGQILGEKALSAATLAINITIIQLLFGLGICVAIPVLTAQARGLGRTQDTTDILRHGTLLAVFFGTIFAIALTLIIKAGGIFMLGQPHDIVEKSIDFAYILAWATVPALVFQAFKNYLDATNRPWISLIWMSTGLLLNIFLNWVFMTGSLGMPNWGLAGAGAGTIFSRTVTLIGMLIFCTAFKFNWLSKIDWSCIKKSLSIGIPTGLQFVFEGGVFFIAPFWMGWINENSIAANQVAMNISSLAFMIPLGLSQASSIFAGEAYGAGDWVRLRRLSKGVITFVIIFMAVYACILITFRSYVPVWYGLEDTTIEIAKNFLIVAGAYAIFDGIQNVSAGLLRGIGDAKIVMWASLFCYWMIGAPIALFLAFPCGLEGVGIWIGLALGLASAALVLGSRLWRDLRREYVPDEKIFA